MGRLGIDIGSKTIKVVVFDDDGNLVYSDYNYHYSRVKRYLHDAIHRIVWLSGDRDVEITVTGSAGMRVAELFNIPFVQEVVALKRAVNAKLPDIDVILEMGGEDTKLVYLTGVPEQRMNTICAGGTGGFIDAMAGLMGEKNENGNLNRLAMGYMAEYPIASRCAVFAKSDVRPLLNAGARKGDIIWSVLKAVCTQAIAGLSAGRPIRGKVALLGGPFEFIPALRNAFCTVTGMPQSDVVVPKEAHLFVATGAAISPEKSASIKLSDFEKRIVLTDFETAGGIERLPKLFDDQLEYDKFRLRHSECVLPRERYTTDATKNLFLGIDAGSTTIKMALIDEAGGIVAYEYDWNQGDIATSFPLMLRRIYGAYKGRWVGDRTLRRSCVIGYGENFCKAAYQVDTGEVETVAHLRAAREIEPDVDFLMDIGGQDIKCFYVRDGVIEDIVLNEACSSGCGSLFDSIARSVKMNKDAFSEAALFAKNPVDLGVRCSTFMDSRVKHAQKEGVPIEDIAAGVCYSTARNALYKVVRQPDFKKVGTHVVVQGGAFANDALLRAFELETGVEVKRPDLSQIMGAYGAALLARDEWLSLRETDERAALAMKSSILPADQIGSRVAKTTTERCGLCTNNCRLVVTTFTSMLTGEVNSIVSGNRCERGAAAYNAASEVKATPPNMVKTKKALLDSYDRAQVGDADAAGGAGAHLVGIPRALALYESYPFWKTFFAALGMRTTTAADSSEELFRRGMASIPAEGACYPSKLTYGHCLDAVEQGADILFVPDMGATFARDGLLGLGVAAGLRECPLIERAGTLVAENRDDTPIAAATMLVPDLRACVTLADAVEPLVAAFAQAGLTVGRAEVEAALEAARAEYQAFFDKLAAANAKVLARVDAGEFKGALVAGHSYHNDPGINHGIDGLLGELGFAVLEQVDYDFAAHAAAPADTAAQLYDWTVNRDLRYSIDASESHPGLQIIIPRSFGCGIDAVAADAAHDRIRRSGRVFAELKIDQIVDLAAVRIRLRSLDYAMRQREGTVDIKRLYPEAVEAVEEQKRVDLEEKRADIEARERAKLAATEHEYDVMRMEGRGYKFIEPTECARRGITRRGYQVIFESASGNLAVFDNWHEVSAAVNAEDWASLHRDSYGHATRRTQRIEGMERLGFHFSDRFGENMAHTVATIVFEKPGLAIWFNGWAEIDTFLAHCKRKIHSKFEGVRDFPTGPWTIVDLKELGAPELPAAPGVTSEDAPEVTFGNAPTVKDVASWASYGRAQESRSAAQSDESGFMAERDKCVRGMEQLGFKYSTRFSESSDYAQYSVVMFEKLGLAISFNGWAEAGEFLDRCKREGYSKFEGAGDFPAGPWTVVDLKEMGAPELPAAPGAGGKNASRAQLDVAPTLKDVASHAPHGHIRLR